MIRKDTDKLISFKFFSLADFYKSVSEKMGTTYYSKQHESGSYTRQYAKFNGATRKEIMERKHSWPEGVSKLKELVDMEKVITKQWVKIWSDDDGDEMDLERYYNDMPFLQKRIKALGTRSRGNNVQKILINVWENCNITAEKMLWKTYTAVKIADELESQGTRCEILLVGAGENIDKRERKIDFEILIKDASEPINTGLLCAVFSPWFFRYWIFHLLYSHIENVTSYLGNAARFPKDKAENCIVIDSGTALSRDSANNFLKGVTA